MSLCNSREANFKELKDVGDGTVGVVGMADREEVVGVVSVIEGAEGWTFFCWWGVGGNVFVVDDEGKGCVGCFNIFSNVVPLWGGR
jgi:hypothetical protein